ncbi:hypothetical protein ACFLRH_01875 [Actinomycetota bacterium]
MKRHGCFLVFSWFIFFILVWLVASTITGGFVWVSDPCFATGDPFCGLGVLATVVGVGLVVAVVVSVIVVSGWIRTSGRGLGRVHGWMLGTVVAVWLTILAWATASAVFEHNEQKRINSAFAEAQEVAEAEYDAALHAWWVDRVAEIVGTVFFAQLREVNRDPEPRCFPKCAWRPAMS